MLIDIFNKHFSETMRKQEKDEKQKQRNRIARVMARVRIGEAGSRDTQKKSK